MCYPSSDLMPKAKLKLESGNQKIQNGRLVAILNQTCLKSNRLPPTDTSNVPLKFGVDSQSQTKSRVQKQNKNSIWLPGGHFVSDVAQNLKLKFHSKLWLRSRKHDAYKWTDRQTKWIQYPPPTPPNSLGLVYWRPRWQSSWGQHGAHLGPVGPRWAPCRPHEPCYQGHIWVISIRDSYCFYNRTRQNVNI